MKRRFTPIKDTKHRKSKIESLTGFTFRVFKLKKRHLWPRNPVTEVKESKKIYRREREKERLRREKIE